MRAPHMCSWTLVAGCLIAGAAPGYAEEPAPAQEPASRPPQIIFSTPLPNLPGQSLTAVLLTPGDAQSFTPHRHPGSVYLFVIEGAVRLGIEGEPARVVEAGGSFFEPAGVLHTVSERVGSDDEPARVLAVIVGAENEALSVAGEAE